MKNITVIGPGLIGKKHIELIEKSPHFNLQSVVNGNAKNSDFSTQYPTYTHIEQLENLESLDAAIISSPNKFHFDQAKFFIQKSIPVLIEKPLTDNIEQAETLIKLAKENNAKVLVGHHRTHSNSIEKAQNLIHSGLFGKITTISGSALFYKPDHYFKEGEWRTKLGGGVILINLIHDIGLLRLLCGEIEYVSAISSNSTRKFEVEDTVSITLQFSNGALGSFIISDCAGSDRSWEMTSGENKRYPHYPNASCYHITGTKGSIDIPTLNYRYYSNDTDASWWSNYNEKTISYETNDPLLSQLNHFNDVINGDAKPKVSIQDGYNNMKVLEAINLSITKKGELTKI